MQSASFDAVVDGIVAADPRYQRGAYFFLRDALDHTQKRLGKPAQNQVRHVTGQQLLEGIRDFSLEQFGPMAITVLEDWGVTRCEDFGELVFNMVDHGMLAKTEQDSRADFRGGYDFETAFHHPFLPPSVLARKSRMKPAQA